MSLPLAIKRINRDIKLCRTTYAEEFEKQGIYVHFDENNTKFCYIMIYGPEKKYDYFAEKEIDTPYYGGFYFFSIDYPINYPYSPPKFKYMTNDGITRFNPNLYINGKVCLSILNTW